MIIVGLRWELSIDLIIAIVLLILIWVKLHKLRIPCSWQATATYAAIVTIACELIHFFTHSPDFDPGDVVDTIHLEVLLPAFAVGCVARSAHTSQITSLQRSRLRGVGWPR